MFARLRSLLSPAEPAAAQDAREVAPDSILAAGGSSFDLAASIDRTARFPLVDWDAVDRWVDALPQDERAAAWGACERAWMLHMRDALGAGMRLTEGKTAMVLSSLGAQEAQRALEFMERTLRRIVKVLDGVAEASPVGKDLLILFDDGEAYYEYASAYHPEDGEFALSSGMCISRGCTHFISTRQDLTLLEPMIAHEMTHGCVAHLALPLWLNEGLAVNTERSIAQAGPPLHTPVEMRRRHLKFWGAEEVQQFWSGLSFRRHDDGNELSYDLARILVEHLSDDWPRFAAFARAAHHGDGGAAAARDHLGLELGEAVAALLEAGDPGPFIPQPGKWREAATWIPEPD